ncbi:MAG: hypothetical protein ACJ749_09215 [Flavisolibacter sp.]
MKQHIIRIQVYLSFFLCLLLFADQTLGQNATDSLQEPNQRKNVIRYNLSGALLFGFDKFIVFGYERVIGRNQSISVNFGKAALPTIVSIITDSFEVKRQGESKGTNFSIDYRFYLQKENKFLPPHGLYIGPYYSYNHFTRENQWDHTNSSNTSYVTSHSELNIHTIGFELGYQFIFWKKLTLDLLMVGPGLGFYNYKASFDSNLSAANKEQLLQGLQQLLTQKFPGFNYVFSDKKLDANGTLNATAGGYRYLMQLGFNF